MSLEEIIGAVGKRKKLLFIIIFLAFLISTIVSIFLIKPTYKASTTMILTKTNTIINPNSNDPNNPVNGKVETQLDYDTVLLNKLLVKTYQELATSRNILKKVAESVNNNTKVDQLTNMVDIELLGETGLIRINVQDTDPEKATLIANTLGKVFVEQIPQLLKINNVQIVDEAEKPIKPFTPNVKFNIILAVMLGAIFGIAIIMIIDYLDNTINTYKDVEKNLNIPVLGSIPKIVKGNPQVCFLDPHSITSETYRILRSNIVFSGIDKSISTLLVTSSIAQEGKSTITSNLGSAFALTGKKVIIIDADLRLPSQHKIFGLSQAPGLTNVILNEVLLEKAIKETDIPGLFVLTTGPLPPNPSEVMSSDRVRELIEKAKQIADIVVIDTAPVTPVTDAAILANQVDGVLMVIKAGKCKIELAQKAYEQMQKANGRILGTVLNSIDMNGSKGYYSYYRKDQKV